MEPLMAVASGLAAVVLVSLALMKWNDIVFGRNGLPPGTMGWPLFGETTEFLKLGPRFMKERRSRYGSVFRSHILGCPTIVSMDPELNRYILLNEETKGLAPGYPHSMLDILGKRNIVAVQGSAHKRIRGSMMSLVNPSVIREQLLRKMDEFMRAHLAGWDGKTIDIQEKTNEMVLYIAFRQIVEAESSTLFNTFKREFDKLFIGTISMPINIPGTSYHKGFQGRNNIVKILSQLMEKRRANSSVIYSDILSLLMQDSKYPLTDEEIIDQIIAFLYTGYETVSTTLMMTVKYLTDHPQVLQKLRDEHLTIRSRKGLMDPINWDDYKSMSFTRAVIFETLRLATVINAVFRRTTEEMKFNGFVIPKGWKIFVYNREINYDPFLYPEPLTFNPKRWMDKELEHHNYCFLFGGGGRLCPGKELGIVSISLFLHYFVTKYRWEEVGGEVIVEFPRVEAPNGLHFRVVANYSS